MVLPETEGLYQESEGGGRCCGGSDWECAGVLGGIKNQGLLGGSGEPASVAISQPLGEEDGRIRCEGTGGVSVEGVAGLESANNAATSAAYA